MDRYNFPIEQAMLCMVERIRTENVMPGFGWHDKFWITHRGALDYERAQSEQRTFRCFYEQLTRTIGYRDWRCG